MNILEATGLDVCFFTGKGKEVHAVNHVSFALRDGEFLGLVGESGCGKSTIAKLVTGLIVPDEGMITLEGCEIHYPFSRQVYRDIQMIFQMPSESFDPRRTIGGCITDMQRNFGASRKEAKARTLEYLDKVGLDASFYKKYPHQMSGGECQRAAIARAFAVEPKVVICDEITSSLDVSVQAQVVELLQELREQTHISLLFISHDLGLVQGLCDRIMVMEKGKIVEEGPASEIIHNPQNAYTRQLLASVLTI
jgi:peptide/nickel transport system ATP-binding protein